MAFIFGLLSSVCWCRADSPNPDVTNLPPRTLVVAPPQRDIPKWLRTNLRIGHLPGYNARMVGEFLKAGYIVVTVNCLGNWDRVGPTAALYSKEEVSRADTYLHKVVDTIHAAGAKSVLYIGPVQVPLLSKEFREAHPDWLRVKPDGSRDENFGNIRSPYADWLCEQSAYVVKHYGADGFWFDGFAPGHLHTYDEQTRRLFREASGGKEIPTGFDPLHDPVARRYLAWHEQYFIDFAERLRGAIRRANPEAAIFANYSANRTWYYPGMAMGEYPAAYCGAIDVASVELYWDVPGDALYQQFCCAFTQATTHNRGASIWIQPQEHGVSGTASAIDIQLRGLEGAPWGVYPEFVESANREEYLKLHVANVKAREKWWMGSEPLPYIGIVASEQTRTLFAQGALPLYFSHTLGAFRAIFEKHWPVRVLTDYDLEDANLAGVRVLVLPNVACMSDRAAEVVRRFVRQGGGLVASFETSLYDEGFSRRKDFALADVLHADYVTNHPVSQRSENLYLSIDAKHPVTDDPQINSKEMTAWLGGLGPPPDSGNLALIASAVECRATDGGQVIASYGLNPPGATGKHPAIIVSTFGEGGVVYFPAAVDKGMFFFPDTYMRAMLANACRWVAGNDLPPAEVEGPLILAATFRRQPNEKRTIVHLLNDHSSYGRHSISQTIPPLPDDLRLKWGYPKESELLGTWPIREEVIPLHDIVVRCRVPKVRRASLEPEHVDLSLHGIADGVEVTVPKLLMHSMVIFESDGDR
jgi:hypothetical protein